MGKATVAFCLLALCAVALAQEMWVTEMKFSAVSPTGSEDDMFTSTQAVAFNYNTGETKSWPSQDDFKFYYPSSECSEDCMDECSEDCEEADEPCAADKCDKQCADKCRDPTVGLKTLFRTGTADETEAGKMMGEVSDMSMASTLKCSGTDGYDCADASASNTGATYMNTNVRGTTFVPVASDTAGFKNFAFTSFDGKDKPSAVYLSQLSTILDDHDMALNGPDGPMMSKEVDVKGINGIVAPGKPANTPWCSVLIPESKTAMTRDVGAGSELFTTNTDLAWIQQYYGEQASDIASLSPYMWGYNVEMRVEDYEGMVGVFKRYGMGRLHWTSVSCAPDMMTCVGSGNGIVVAYVASDKMDLSKGRLFFGMWDGDSLEFKEFVTKYMVEGESSDTATLTCPYGQDCAAAMGSEISEDMVMAKAQDSSFGFSDMFEVGAAPADGVCADGFSFVKMSAGLVPADECLKVKAEMDTQEGRSIIARLETYRMAAMMGAAVNIEMVSGVVSSIDDDWKDGDDREEGLWFWSFKMITSELDKGEAFDENMCGCVYRSTRGSFKEADVDAGELLWDGDDLEMATLSSWMPKKFEKVTCGMADNAGVCDDDLVAYPMDISWSQYHNTLFIGEYMGGHDNARVWAFETPYNRDAEAAPSNGELKAIAIAPKGASAQGLMWHQNLVYNALSYLTVSFGMPRPMATGAMMSDKAGYQTYLGPFPMQGYISGSSDILPNLGCPRWEANSYKYKPYVANMA
mmetsp:Transcript_48631/g.75911  ORF Transcript_48631/g.75911 Transcript_48631/m.75911 type:complete len:747 (-) Transcript_48631:74-2314(-)|eukprot:CAMPEP_0184310532 /NCGR_PEP_ID=MMETSP1049-20130417/31116_1 /TAXON_ID=77928 /ORGANISM="Proteomonas sulcata, Strain CCMP704" /LENGTH=746 /DNA_ID=CAMNT_0026624839 /DNA_START=78 /DNA_END=2318 /DNA_ORIENTATION=+